MAEQSGRLVIIDDEPVILSLLASMFDGDSGIEVVTCADGAEGRAAITQGVDVLLTDKNLPDVGGLELAREARRLHPDVEIIVITGYASLDTALIAMELDVFDYIVKPPKDIHDVRRKVLQAFDKQALARENRRLLARLKEQNAELQHALDELRQVQAELVQSEKLAGIGTLAAGVAHEISSPLFGVMGLAEAILDEDDATLARGYATEIVEYASSIKEIVVQLSGYSRAAGSEYLAAVDLAEVAHDAVKLVVRSSGVDPDWVSVDGPRGVMVHARANELQQVFVNLVRNAVEALEDVEDGGAPRAPRVAVQISAADRGARATVLDNGPGIEPEHVSVIFDPFFTTKPPGRGTGLGLNIVYRIVTRYQGTIKVQSERGEGTRFELALPLAGSAEP